MTVRRNDSHVDVGLCRGGLCSIPLAAVRDILVSLARIMPNAHVPSRRKRAGRNACHPARRGAL
jgi:hypothetical protein